MAVWLRCDTAYAGIIACQQPKKGRTERDAFLIPERRRRDSNVSAPPFRKICALSARQTRSAERAKNIKNFSAFLRMNPAAFICADKNIAHSIPLILKHSYCFLRRKASVKTVCALFPSAHILFCRNIWRRVIFLSPYLCKL